MATAPEIGKNRHRALVEDAQAGAMRLRGTLGALVEELDGQHRQARPRLDGLAVLMAQAVRQAVTVEGYLSEMQGLIATARASRGEVDELAESVEALRVLVVGLVERGEVGSRGRE
jgi:ABC-type transporter Mla subunit MlaD